MMEVWKSGGRTLLFVGMPVQPTRPRLMMVASKGTGDMSQSAHRQNEISPGNWLEGGGEMGKLVRSMDWAETTLEIGRAHV